MREAPENSLVAKSLQLAKDISKPRKRPFLPAAIPTDITQKNKAPVNEDIRNTGTFECGVCSIII
jgi:hypothetical protein